MQWKSIYIFLMHVQCCSSQMFVSHTLHAQNRYFAQLNKNVYRASLGHVWLTNRSFAVGNVGRFPSYINKINLHWNTGMDNLQNYFFFLKWKWRDFTLQARTYLFIIFSVNNTTDLNFKAKFLWNQKRDYREEGRCEDKIRTDRWKWAGSEFKNILNTTFQEGNKVKDLVSWMSISYCYWSESWDQQLL